MIILLENHKLDYSQPIELGDLSIEGIFGTVTKAREHLRRECLDLYTPGSSGADHEWGSRMYICEVKQVVQQIPVVELKCRLKTVERVT